MGGLRGVGRSRSSWRRYGVGKTTGRRRRATRSRQSGTDFDAAGRGDGFGGRIQAKTSRRVHGTAGGALVRSNRRSFGAGCAGRLGRTVPSHDARITLHINPDLSTIHSCGSFRRVYLYWSLILVFARCSLFGSKKKAALDHVASDSLWPSLSCLVDMCITTGRRISNRPRSFITFNLLV